LSTFERSPENANKELGGFALSLSHFRLRKTACRHSPAPGLLKKHIHNAHRQVQKIKMRAEISQGEK